MGIYQRIYNNLILMYFLAFSEEKDFETARGGGNQQTRIIEAPKLSLDNKFSALRN